MNEVESLRSTHKDTLSIISHDIRAPLGVILGAVTELLNPELGELSDDQRALVQLVRRSSEKLSRLANNVAALNRIEAGGLDLSRQSVDVRVIARRALEAFERAGELGKVTVRTAAPNEAAPASVDVERATLAITNLLANALRFARREVTLTITRDEGAVHVDVEDDGPGVAADAFAGLFDRARRVRAAGGNPGGGLGLLVVKGIVDAHGGAVAAANRGEAGAPPAGARFRISFPISKS